MIRDKRALCFGMSRALLAASIALACSDHPTRGGMALTTFAANLDPPVAVGDEAYECRLFDASELKGAAVHELRWTPPSGALRLHHAMMFVTPEAGPPGPWPCEPMPPAITVLPLYAPGGESSKLADGVSIVIPPAGQRLFMEMHLYRRDLGASSVSVEFLTGDAPPKHLAAWVDDPADVPPIRPHTAATATASCRFGGPVHVVGSWPHMHQLGTRFEGTIVRADATRETLVHVPAWDFDHEPLYAVDASLGDGDAIETACHWDNQTDITVQSGPFSRDEMCNQGLIVWPQESAVCVR